MTVAEEFPDVEFAAENGLIAFGGDLGPGRLLKAYRRGIFPWYSPGEPILWWTPDPRCVLYPEEFHASRSLKRSMRRRRFEFSFDRDFAGVIENCAATRHKSPGTWITRDMKKAYTRLHHIGYAHSVEAWQDGQLAGGLYGVALGGMFFGESMFSRVTDASKAALYCLVTHMLKWNFSLMDCQVTSPHLLRLGARIIPRAEFLATLERAIEDSGRPGSWSGVDAGAAMDPRTRP